MREWLTARELAEMHLPKMPWTRLGVANSAERMRWATRETRRNGGMTREYYLLSIGFPEAARLEIMRREALQIESTQGRATAARVASHNQEAAGSTPAPATRKELLAAAITADPQPPQGVTPVLRTNGMKEPSADGGDYPRDAAASMQVGAGIAQVGSAPEVATLNPEVAGSSPAAGPIQIRPGAMNLAGGGGEQRSIMPSPEINAMWRAYEAAPHTWKAQAKRRARIVSTVEAAMEAGMGKVAAYGAVAKAEGVGRSTVETWCARARGYERQHWTAALIPEWRGGGKRTEYDDRIYMLFRDLYLTTPPAPSTKCYLLALEALAKQNRDAQLAAPDRGTLLRRVRREYPLQTIRYLRYGERAVELMIPAQRRSVAHLHAMQIINGDGHICDYFVKFADGEVRRPILAAVADIYSRPILSWRLGKTENVDLVRLVYGDLFESLGLCDEAYFDNGRAWMAKTMTGGMKHRFRWKRLADEAYEECRGVLETLGIRVHATFPFHGQSKPIERAFKEIEEWLATDPRVHGAYTGNRPDAKPEDYGSRAIPIEEFERVMAGAIKHYNEAPNRRTEASRGVMSLRAAFEESFKLHPPRQVTPEQRFLWRLASRPLTVRQDGSISLYGNRYAHEALLNFAGKQVVVRFDHQRLHEPIRAYAPNGAFVVDAECIENRGYNDVEAARDDMRSRRAFVKAAKAFDDAQHRMARATLERQVAALDAPAAEAAKPARALPERREKQPASRAFEHLERGLALYDKQKDREAM